MTRKSKFIPVRSVSDDIENNIMVVKASSKDYQLLEQEARYDHRHDSHFFVLQEQGTVHTEIDFEKYVIEKSTIYYQSPQQVHRVTKVENIELYLLSIDQEHFNQNYLNTLQRLSPLKPLVLNPRDLQIIKQSFSLCIKLFTRNKDQLYFSQLKDGCNMLIALMISQFMKEIKPIENLSRFEFITKSFTELLERNFIKLKRPSDYASQLHISTAYLNECIKEVTGFSTSHLIQQRIILEAKRLLYHTDQSVKEIAAALGYEDYAYFSRFFSKTVGMTALTFREKTAH